MPTINQLVRKGRTTTKSKSTSPALQHGYNSRKKKLYSTYNFEKLDPTKISKLFREKRGITPYEFAKLDFENRSLVECDGQTKKSKKTSSNERVM